MSHEDLKIGVVGPCTAGKTTLINGLINNGYKAKQIAQEHSYVQDMWDRLTHPDILIYLDVSYSYTMKRRNLNWSISEYNTQVDRLRHAREHADIQINTDSLSPQNVLDQVLKFLDSIYLTLDNTNK
jgi:deoxyadenosine/deoxycytidine kinase